MSNQQEEPLTQMINNIRDDLKEHRKETREDIKSLEKKTEIWHEEVRDEFTGVKDRLTTIETQTATRASDRRTSWEKIVAIMAFIVSAATAVVMYLHK